ncbi:hypothetical protein KY366_05855 [Candidatus Woesearchaeota archaeon]|nr:hypothetical protein [Candidatus Woesearchaeota archaeon]
MNKRIITISLLLAVIILMVGCFGRSGKSRVEGKKESDLINVRNHLFNTKYVEPIGASQPEETLAYAAEAIKNGDIEEALKMFDENAHDSMRDFLNGLDLRGREKLAQDLSNATLDKESEIPITDDLKTYKMQIQVEGRGLITTGFNMIRLPNGNWVIMDL